MLRKCRTCGKEACTEEDLKDFLPDKKSKHGKQNLCYSCSRASRNLVKLQAIAYKGSKCSCCGISYDGTNGSIFDFHHLNPDEKEFSLGNKSNPSWETVKKEIDKCILLCANCHRLEHSSSF